MQRKPRCRSTCPSVPASAPPADTGGSSWGRTRSDPPLMHFTRNPDRRLTGIVSSRAPGPRGSCGVQHVLTDLVRMPRRIPVGRPLPDVADHVVEPIAVAGTRAHRRRALISVECQVLPGKLTLRCVRHIAVAGPERRRPMRIRRPRARLVRRAPTRPRWATICPPTRANASASPNVRCTTGCCSSPSRPVAAPCGCRQSAARKNVHQFLKFRISRCDRRAARRRASLHRAFRAARPDTRAGSGAFSAKVTCPVASTNRVNRAFATGSRSIQNPSTDTRRAGRSSG